jgi:hypothetical protein
MFLPFHVNSKPLLIFLTVFMVTEVNSDRPRGEGKNDISVLEKHQSCEISSFDLVIFF